MIAAGAPPPPPPRPAHQPTGGGGRYDVVRILRPPPKGGISTPMDLPEHPGSPISPALTSRRPRRAGRGPARLWKDRNPIFPKPKESSPLTAFGTGAVIQDGGCVGTRAAGPPRTCRRSLDMGYGSSTTPFFGRAAGGVRPGALREC
eukprot:gene13900-biopygen2035